MARIPLPGLCPSIHGLAFHHIAMFVVAATAAVTALLLAGSGSNAIAEKVYLLQLTYVNSDSPPDVPHGVWENITLPAFEAVRDAHLRVRVGYFGVCAAQDSNAWKCQRSMSTSVTTQRLVDPLGIINMAEKVKSDVVFPGLLIGSGGLALILIVLFSLYPGWHKETDERTGSEFDVKPFPERSLLMACLAVASLATLFALTSALWQHTASATAATVLETSAVSVIKVNVGTVGTALAWLVFGLWLIILVMVVLIVTSIMILDRMVEED